MPLTQLPTNTPIDIDDYTPTKQPDFGHSSQFKGSNITIYFPFDGMYFTHALQWLQSRFLSPLLLFWLEANLKDCQILILLATSIFNTTNNLEHELLFLVVHSSKSG
ncbi:hypothetical protein L2E82_06321 [Cichorium intybus]|uniref:Uncharacterized protein n=1 Tax=Cichorium intybus TaxID=13427 RepID=A0ACB9HAA0_CICIN|nr:hypothetical protein L2E82_06321 [Cichorium intybus]